jgi:hypothetical protein
MKLNIFTLVLDGMPWLIYPFAELTRLVDIDWQWTIIHGAAMNVKDTAWCQPQAGRLSSDGTALLLESFAHHPRIRVIERAKWEGKVEMCNAALATFTTPEWSVLMQMDVDELWTAAQLRDIVHLFEDDASVMSARFHCRYFLTSNCITTDAGKPNEWLRAWRFQPSMRFATHEPPSLTGSAGKSLNRRETAAMGLVFDHHSWTHQSNVAYKERFYGPRYKGALDGWRKLQANTEWPVRDAGVFLPAPFRGTPANKIF